jgi:hypothetical protein
MKKKKMVSSLKRKPTVTIIMRAWASRPNLQRNHSIKTKTRGSVVDLDPDPAFQVNPDLIDAY